MKLSEITKRRFKFGTNMLILTLVVIIAFVLVNVLLEKLPLTLDFTEQKLYTISENSIDILKDLEKKNKKIEISCLYDRVKGEADANLSVVIKLLDKYDEYKNIEVKYIDTDKNPSYLINTVGQERAAEYKKGDYILKSGDNIRKIASDDMYEKQLNYQTFRIEIVGFSIERIISSAIIFVTSDVIPKLYISNGFGENDIQEYKSLFRQIEYMNFEIDTIDLNKSEIPEDASIILFNGPKSDLSTVVYDKLITWFDKGGHNAMFLMDYDLKGTKMDNFNKLFDFFNIKMNNDLVYESEDYHLPNNARFFSANTLTAGSLEQAPRSKVYIFNSRSFEVLSRTKDYIFADQIIVSSKDAKAVAIEESTDENDLKDKEGEIGSHVLAASSKYTLPEKTSRIMVTGSSLNIRDDYVSKYGADGGGVLIYTMNWMYFVKNEASLIKSVSLSSGNSIKVTENQKDFLGIFSIFIWPAAILVTGGVVWFRRRHL